MKITDLLTKDTIIMDLGSSSKKDVLDELAGQLKAAGKLNDEAAYREAIDRREQESTTGVGEGIAIPHAKTSAVETPAIAFGRSMKGIDYDSLDGEPAHLFFMIAASAGANNAHLETLSKLSTYLLHKPFREKLMAAKTPEDIIDLFEQEENDQNDEESEADGHEGSGKRLKLVAVTGCPTGIAHTYMAADSLKEKAKELGYDMKVQTNGSTGIKNRLTEEDIKEAAGVIVAADTKVDMAPFEGKHLVEAPVTAGIRNPEGLIREAVSGEAPVYKGSGSSYQDKIREGKEEKKAKQPAFYRHLMNGVSHMLPFVVGGGILIALSFFFGIHSADPKSPEYNAFAHALNTIGGGNAMALMIPILAGYIAYSIAERPGLAPGAVGGLMAATSGAGFLGGLIAGFLAGYVVVLLKKVFEKLPESLEGLKPVLLFPVFGIFITGMAMYLIDQPIGAIMDAITGWLNSLGTSNLVLLGIILGGMMAIDMGGPINKAAYTFGLAMIDAGNFYPQAATMAGGMVPPLGMALATTLFARKFSNQERSAGKTAYVLGASFITEGAIPFAAADPYRVIISSVIGSAVTGGLALFFGTGLRAPHGGIFVIPFVNGSAWLYVLSIIIGAFITAVIYGLWRKPLRSK
ncbi:PTS system D-fructose-specific IIA component (F1P-forming) (Frc family) /PTS system D-fructose-specific IIB component (F1P-forming) (Frc family) /PTS system D-fructose-specific IIC component (F1P-forming) (Frc family) [Scopulibacillus darangshiensis]|uniref:PTS system D-fructose-specific IIA component (F1P-forming) (Frc family) /PTS system D-fructose-specific IIB component (F1P-forming) (Frc family) /PTS system D-fructose-specific IIC component (F1P-f... n=1 Tax=Scopulibacillus darangshiensis TaxID=442528 RepID=A0A4R2NHC4_9BACL|nr:PTS fructose transporter subunit IIABC [Scopulibacillus darangshiensis]TCP20859.1 PTS system D-fructose-specific IIA component (F1P-forming) (Frc family) /PTS system D-fructose-specific IIB component (F1P-forming) (Frc family) /PTS system D-fructose-specific IIC component (F1P-forming) (Frc family) [Scopulibacillus darangshiensis]